MKISAGNPVISRHCEGPSPEAIQLCILVMLTPHSGNLTPSRFLIKKRNLRI